jgi:hypothetical protein
MSQETPSPRPTFVRTAIVVGAAVMAALGGGYAIAANAPTPRQVVSPPAAPAELVGITPVRVLDTRGAAGGPIGVPTAAKLSAGQTIDVAVGGVGAIPKDAISVAVNITIDEDATLKSFLTVWPTGEVRPNTSANNAEPGLVSPNSAIFQLGTGGKLSVFNQQGTVNVIMDVTGYFVPEGASGTTTTTTSTTTTVPAAALLFPDPTYTAGSATGHFSGTGFVGCGPVTVTLTQQGGGTTATLGPVTPNAGGAIASTTFTVPTPAATYDAVADNAATDPQCHATATLTVTP